MAPLYITESLTPANRVLYTALLDARRPENGGRVASVFTRRGQVMCRVERGGANIRVPDLEHLQRLLNGPARGCPPAGRPGAPPGRVGGHAPSRPASPGGGPPPAPAPAGPEPAEPPSGRRPPLLPTPGRATPSTPSSSQLMGAASSGAAPPPPAPPAGPPGSGPSAQGAGAAGAEGEVTT